MFINWKLLDRIFGNPAFKFFMIYLLVFFIIIGFLIGLTGGSNSGIDTWGHVGGLIFGFCVFVAITKPSDSSDSACCQYKYWMIICSSIVICFTITGFTCYFLLDTYAVKTIK